jgi:plasmid stabilization system protein ParE
MRYPVDLAANAAAELEQLYLWVVAQAPHRGPAWFNGLEKAILSLDRHPDRCPIAPEGLDSAHPIRVLHYGRRPHIYSVFFTVDHADEAVRIVHVRHGARKPATPDEFRDR